MTDLQRLRYLAGLIKEQDEPDEFDYDDEEELGSSAYMPGTLSLEFDTPMGYGDSITQRYEVNINGTTVTIKWDLKGKIRRIIQMPIQYARDHDVYNDISFNNKGEWWVEGTVTPQKFNKMWEEDNQYFKKTIIVPDGGLELRFWNYTIQDDVTNNAKDFEEWLYNYRGNRAMNPSRFPELTNDIIKKAKDNFAKNKDIRNDLNSLKEKINQSKKKFYITILGKVDNDVISKQVTDQYNNFIKEQDNGSDRFTMEKVNIANMTPYSYMHTQTWDKNSKLFSKAYQKQAFGKKISGAEDFNLVILNECYFKATYTGEKPNDEQSKNIEAKFSYKEGVSGELFDLIDQFGHANYDEYTKDGKTINTSKDKYNDPDYFEKYINNLKGKSLTSLKELVKIFNEATELKNSPSMFDISYSYDVDENDFETFFNAKVEYIKLDGKKVSPEQFEEWNGADIFDWWWDLYAVLNPDSTFKMEWKGDNELTTYTSYKPKPGKKPDNIFANPDYDEEFIRKQTVKLVSDKNFK